MPNPSSDANDRESDLSAEQAVVDAAYEHLARMRARAEKLAAEMAGTDPDLDWALTRRAKALAETPRALCFGRTDSAGGDTWYVGRRHVEDEMGDPVVVEWRAPVALPFYRASWADPMGLTRRRQFVVDGHDILSIGDDHFGLGQPETAGLRGAEALSVELERARTGEMLDIVATIQPEQDEVIRSPADGVLVVQGGPGSGKTAVGLHRAAFLLYADDAMARANILVVGPNRTFLRYIAQVLPSLGEHAVVQTTLLDLVPEAPVRAGDRRGSPASERLKGDSRMAEVLASALAKRLVHHDEDLEVPLGLRRIVVPAGEVNASLDAAASRRIPYVSGRELFRDLLVRALYDRYVDAAGEPADGSGLGQELRRAKALKRALDLRWPTVALPRLVADLLFRPALLAAAAGGLLSKEEQKVLSRRRSEPWTPADAPLVDEAKHLVHGSPRSYGYAIVDEAQDLSPMELRMLARRCPGGALTLLGDLAQSTGPWGLRSWEEIAAHLAPAGRPQVVELPHAYRSTAQVIDFAARLLPEAAPFVSPTVSVRRGRSEPRVLRVAPAALVGSLVEEAASLGEDYATVGVIVPEALATEVASAAASVLPSAGEVSRDGLAKRVTVLAASGAKGLEFDAVVVGEPAQVVGEQAAAAGSDLGAGLRLLYVALTRPTQHLSVVHSDALPPSLAS